MLAGLFETFDKDGNMELDRDEMKEVEEFLQLPETEVTKRDECEGDPPSTVKLCQQEGNP